MGAKFSEVMCGEHGISGGGECCANNDEQLGRINVFYHEASGGMCVSRVVLFDLEPGVIGAFARQRSASCFRPGNLTNQNAGAGTNLAKGYSTQGLERLFSESLCIVAAFFKVISEPHRPSVRVCVGPVLARCIHLAVIKMV
jgi:tubulin beta